MPADANLLQQYLQAPRSVMDYQADMDQRDALRQRNAIQALALQQQTAATQQGLAERNALQRIAAGWTPQTTVADRVAALRGSGLPGLMDQADKLETADLTRRKTDAEINDKTADTSGKNYKLAQQKREDAIRRLVAFQSPQDALADLKDSVGRGEIGMPEAQAMLQRIPQDPAQFGQWQLATLRGLMSPEQAFNASKPVLQTRDSGGLVENLAVDPLTGKPTVTASTKKTMTPGEVASNSLGYAKLGEDKRHNKATEEAGQTVYDAERGVVVSKPTGLARPAATMDGKPLAAKTPESVKKELSSIDGQLSVLDGAIKDVKATPGAFTFKRGLATMAGPLTESVAGRLDSSGERDARSYVFNVVSKVINERAGAAQSAQELARLRSFLPAETDNAQQIVDKLESFKGYLADLGNGYQPGKYQPQAKPSAAGPVQIKDDAGYDALPSGATFIGPDGKTRRKP